MAGALKIVTEAGQSIADTRKSLAEANNIQAEARKLVAETSQSNVGERATLPGAELRQSWALTTMDEPVAALALLRQQAVIARSEELEPRALEKLAHGIDTGSFAATAGDSLTLARGNETLAADILRSWRHAGPPVRMGRLSSG